jgi:hypothetical protein
MGPRRSLFSRFRTSATVAHPTRRVVHARGVRAVTRAAVAVLSLGLVQPGVTGCYPTGEGVPPPEKRLYFPTGVAVSPGGSVLYVANSNFDLQYDGGTVQAFDLSKLRAVAGLAADNFDGPPAGPPSDPCRGTLLGVPLRRERFGEPCAAESDVFYRNHRIIGAFATDLQVARTGFTSLGAPTRRLFIPVRGDASVTWIDLPDDAASPNVADRFALRCGSPREAQGAESPGGSCDDAHHAGQNPSEPGNSRGIVLPGEPFGMAFSEDERALVLTHQTADRVSLLATGLGAATAEPPSLQFVLDGVNTGGVGITPIPHDPAAFVQAAPRAAFLHATRSKSELTRIRYYPDETLSDASTLQRPFMVREATFPINANASGIDSRSVLIDPTPREVCKSKVSATDPDRQNKLTRCARLPARLFIANRSPASLIIGEVGDENNTATGPHDADSVRVFESIPLAAGPSKLFMAPIVDRDGAYALRLFIVCFDASTIFIYDPDTRAVDGVIRTALGPFAMAFDPFDLREAMLHATVASDTREGVTQRRYRYAYVASFTNSVVQVIDLDNARVGNSTFQRILFSLGEPTQPKGTN